MQQVDSKRAYQAIVFAQEQVLVEIRLAIQSGDRLRAVGLAAQRYELLKQLAESTTHRSPFSDPTFLNLRPA
jgi:hypothetical protein